jgi:hypothetical protein
VTHGTKVRGPAMLTPMCGRVRLSSDVSEIRLAGPEYARPRHHRPRASKMIFFSRISILVIPRRLSC